MGDARKYPEIRALRYQYATLFLPRDLRNDAEYRKRLHVRKPVSYSQLSSSE